ncbi:formamidopyrimidine-DNA glycosylase [Chloropicon primus]|nr:formamidopyrimidine-DNA glycosylase [Chloropicon primus]
MPELPEVERAKDLIRDEVVGRTIVEVNNVDDHKVIQGVDEPKELEKHLVGWKVTGVKRKGKYLVLELEEGGGNSPSSSDSNSASKQWITAHFGMTGSFLVKGLKPGIVYKSFDVDESSWPPRFWKVCVVFSDGTELSFVDARRFGRFKISRCDPMLSKPLCDLGPDALLEPPSCTELHNLLLQRKGAIKAVLLDQSFLSGIGNWVGDEILFQSSIHPEQPANTLTADQSRALHSAMEHVLVTATSANADSSKFPSSWLFHSRWTGKKATKVEGGKQVKFITVGGRTSAFVPSVQKKTGRADSKKRKSRS